jgi:hypothetical protein
MCRLTFILTLLIAAPVSADSPLAWKFAEGDVFFLQRDVHGEQIVTIKEKPLRQETQGTWIYRFEVRKADKDAATLEARVHSAKIQHLVGTAGVESKWLDRMKGAMFTLEVDRRGKIAKWSGYDALAAQVSDKKADVEKVVRQLWPEALIRQQFDDMLAVIPDRAVVVGDKWQESRLLHLSAAGTFITEHRKSFAEVDRAGHVHITGTVTGKYQPPPTPADIFRVTGGDLKIEKGRWQCVFDRERGRPLRTEEKIEIQGQLTVELSGMPVVAELNMKSEAKTKLLSKEP